MHIADLITRLQELQDKGYKQVLMSGDPEGNYYYTVDDADPIWQDSLLELGYTEEDRPNDEFINAIIIGPGIMVEPWE